MTDWAPDEYDHASDDRWMTESEIVAAQVDAALYAVAAAFDAFAGLPGQASAEDRRAAIMERRGEVHELVSRRVAERAGQDSAPAPKTARERRDERARRRWGLPEDRA